jgi:hypothetical protein
MKLQKLAILLGIDKTLDNDTVTKIQSLVTQGTDGSPALGLNLSLLADSANKEFNYWATKSNELVSDTVLKAFNIKESIGFQKIPYLACVETTVDAIYTQIRAVSPTGVVLSVLVNVSDSEVY